MSIASVGSTPTTTLQTGIFTGGALGDGAFARVVQQKGNTETITATRTNAAGQSSTGQVTVTRNADGTVTRDATWTNAQGQKVQRDLTLGVDQDGTRSVDGTITSASGSVDQVSGSLTATSNGFNEALSLTNPAGQTANAAVAYTQAGSVDTTGITGTGFQGDAISQQFGTTTLSSLTLGALPAGGTVV